MPHSKRLQRVTFAHLLAPDIESILLGTAHKGLNAERDRLTSSLNASLGTQLRWKRQSHLGRTKFGLSYLEQIVDLLLETGRADLIAGEKSSETWLLPCGDSPLFSCQTRIIQNPSGKRDAGGGEQSTFLKGDNTLTVTFDYRPITIIPPTNKEGYVRAATEITRIVIQHYQCQALCGRYVIDPANPPPTTGALPPTSPPVRPTEGLPSNPIDQDPSTP